MLKNIKKYTAILASVVLISGCQRMVEGLDISPNLPTGASSNPILTGTQLANIQLHEGEIARLAGMWCGYFTGSDRQYISLYEYNTTAGDFDNAWSPIYPFVVKQARTIQSNATKTNNRLMLGIAKVIEAHALGTATALWGDVPNTEAVDLVKFPMPKYDSQLQVYTALQALLDGAIADLTAGVVSAVTSPGISDIYYQGNKAKWIAAAYTLKARYYMHTKEYAKALAVAKLGIQKPADNMMGTHGPVFGSNFNTYYDFLQYNRPGYMTADGAFAPTLLEKRGNAKTDEAARLGYVYMTDNGYYEPNAYCVFDGWGATGMFGGDTSFPLITFEENNLILAEAAARGGDTAGALASLNAHRAYMNSGGYLSADWGTPMYAAYTTADFQAGGIENPTPSIAADRALLREILEERYVTFIGQIEGFNDVRRTLKETDVRVPVTPNKGTQFPQRFLYPQAEVSANKNVPNPFPGLFVATPVNK